RYGEEQNCCANSIKTFNDCCVCRFHNRDAYSNLTRSTEQNYTVKVLTLTSPATISLFSPFASSTIKPPLDVNPSVMPSIEPSEVSTLTAQFCEVGESFFQ